MIKKEDMLIALLPVKYSPKWLFLLISFIKDNSYHAKTASYFDIKHIDAYFLMTTNYAVYFNIFKATNAKSMNPKQVNNDRQDTLYVIDFSIFAK